LNIALYISGHGFGHASRSIELIHAIVATRPDARIVVKTMAPRWLFDGAQLRNLTYEALETDVGMTQTDGLTMDVTDTVRRAAEFYSDFDRRAASEAAWLRREGAAVVLGDIPPLAHAAAARAGIPSVAIGNFTWDWIYEGYSTFEHDAPGVIQTIRDAYRHTTRALRLPMHGGFAPMSNVTVDIPMIARRSSRSREDTRALMTIPGDRPLVLASFGGHGLDVSGRLFEEIARRERLTVLHPGAALAPPLQYQDLVAAADVVITKPGYGIISECVANGTPLLYTSRGPFVEYDVFVAEMPRVLRCRFLPQEDLRTGRWREHIEALLAQAAPPARAAVNGAAIAAAAILDLVNG
jgi:hypothetical protein